VHCRKSSSHKENHRLQAENAWLRTHNPAADVERSNFVDDTVAIEFAIECGYISAFSSHDAKEDRKLREEAKRCALEYFRKHLPARLAAANH
jgi:hypothetical protein